MFLHSRVIAVPADVLPNCPKAFREYVEIHFEEQDIFGRKSLVALSSPTRVRDRGKKGMAYMDRGYLLGFTEGLNGQSLHDWIEEAAQDGIIWSFACSWEG